MEIFNKFKQAATSAAQWGATSTYRVSNMSAGALFVLPLTLLIKNFLSEMRTLRLINWLQVRKFLISANIVRVVATNLKLTTTELHEKKNGEEEYYQLYADIWRRHAPSREEHWKSAQEVTKQFPS